MQRWQDSIQSTYNPLVADDRHRAPRLRPVPVRKPARKFVADRLVVRRDQHLLCMYLCAVRTQRRVRSGCKRRVSQRQQRKSCGIEQTLQTTIQRREQNYRACLAPRRNQGMRH